MRKLSAVLVVVLLCSSTLSAQKVKQKASFGFKAGTNISTFRSAIDYPDFDQSFKLGMVFGGFVQIPVSSSFYIQPEFLYSQLGGKAESSLWGDATFRYNYFSVPVLAKYKIGNVFNVYAGAEFDFLIRARLKQLYKTTTVTYDVKDFDFAYTAGFGTNGKKWTFDARYIHGSQDVSPETAVNSFFNQAVQFTVGYKLQPKTKKAAKAKKKK